MADYTRDGVFHCFTLTDAEGEEHQYKLKPHGGDDGQEIVFRILALGAEPVGEIVQGLSKAETIREKIATAWDAGGLEALQELDPLEMLDGVDFAGLGKSVKQVLAEGKAPQLVRDLLSETHRDDQPMSNRIKRQKAYARNYDELLLAAYHSIAINRFFPGSAILSIVDDETETDPELDDR
jgi:hypothetical protein